MEGHHSHRSLRCPLTPQRRRPFDMRMLKISVGPAPGEVNVLLGTASSDFFSRLTHRQVRPVCTASSLQSSANRAHYCPCLRTFSPSSWCRRAERPTEGFFHFNTEFSPMASPAFEPGRPPESAIELGRIVERGLRESKAIDTEALCIVAGVKVR